MQDHLVHEGGFCPRAAPRTVREKAVLVVTHLLCLGPVLRQLQILRLGRRELRLRSRSPAHSNISGPYCVRDPAHLQASH